MAYKTIYPYTNEVLKEYANHTEVDLENALTKGHSLYKKWRKNDCAFTSCLLQLDQLFEKLRYEVADSCPLSV